jgi:hypothetical protein
MAADSNGSAGATPPLVIDNAGAEFIGKWYSSSENQDKYGADYRYAASTDGELSAVAVYRPRNVAPGAYDVEIWYSAAENRSPNAHWVVCSDGRAVAARVNQQIKGGQWVRIAERRPFNGASEECIFTSNFGTKGTAVIADAVRLIPSPKPERGTQSTNAVAPIVLDNEDATFEGDWTSSSITAQKYGKDYRYAVALSKIPAASALYQPTFPGAGQYDVEIFYAAGPNRSTASCWIISCARGALTNRVNQRISGGSWVRIGKALPFESGRSGFVKLTNEPSEAGASKAVVIADAVRFVPVR